MTDFTSQGSLDVMQWPRLNPSSHNRNSSVCSSPLKTARLKAYSALMATRTGTAGTCPKRTWGNAVVFEHLQLEQVLRGRAVSVQRNGARNSTDDEAKRCAQNETRRATRAERGMAAWK
jgi:hypothetical protein